MPIINTDEHYFKNARRSQVKPIQGKNVEQPTFNSSLLIVLKWPNITEFVYKTHSIFVREDAVEIQPYKERENSTAQEIIQRYIDSHKKSHSELVEILACNPTIYPTEQLASQYM